MAIVSLGMTLRSRALDLGMDLGWDLRKSQKCHLMLWRGLNLTTTVSKSRYLNVVIPTVYKSQYSVSLNLDNLD